MTRDRAAIAPAEVLLAYLFMGLVAAGGLRDPFLWTAAGIGVWLVAAVWPAPRALPALKPWLPWLGWSLLALLTCAQPAKGVYACSRWLSLIVFFSLLKGHWTERDSSRWLAGLALSSLALGAGSLLLPGTTHPMTGLLPPYYNYTMFVEAAGFAAALGALGHPAGPRGRTGWALGGLMAFAVMVMVLARSRGALAAAAAAAGLWLIRRGRGRPLVWGLLAGAAVFLLAPRLSAHLLKLDLAPWFTRPQIWTAALRIAGDHPFLGEGPGNFESGFLRHNFAKSWGSRYCFFSDHAHSEVLELAALTGWVGLALFLRALRRSVSIPDAKAAGPTQEAGLLAFTAMACHCLVDNMLHIPALGMLFFSSIAAAGAEPGPAEPAGPAPGPWRPLAVGGLLACALAYLPQHLAARYAALAEDEGRPAERLALLDKAIRLYPADNTLREAAARTCLKARPPDGVRALAELSLASRLNPTNAFYPELRAELALEQGRPAEAAGLLNRAIALEPDFLGARLARAELWAARGRRKAARRELGEISRRRALLRDMREFSDCDRALTALDPERFKAAQARVRGPGAD